MKRVELKTRDFYIQKEEEIAKSPLIIPLEKRNFKSILEFS